MVSQDVVIMIEQSLADVLSSEAVCTYGNAVYSVHEEWRDGVCRNCSCVAGGQTVRKRWRRWWLDNGVSGANQTRIEVCRELVCPSCADPISVSPDSCCPLCKGGRGEIMGLMDCWLRKNGYWIHSKRRWMEKICRWRLGIIRRRKRLDRPSFNFQSIPNDSYRPLTRRYGTLLIAIDILVVDTIT